MINADKKQGELNLGRADRWWRRRKRTVVLARGVYRTVKRWLKSPSFLWLVLLILTLDGGQRCIVSTFPVPEPREGSAADLRIGIAYPPGSTASSESTPPMLTIRKRAKHERPGIAPDWVSDMYLDLSLTIDVDAPPVILLTNVWRASCGADTGEPIPHPPVWIEVGLDEEDKVLPWFHTYGTFNDFFVMPLVVHQDGTVRDFKQLKVDFHCWTTLEPQDVERIGKGISARNALGDVRESYHIQEGVGKLVSHFENYAGAAPAIDFRGFNDLPNFRIVGGGQTQPNSSSSTSSPSEHLLDNPVSLTWDYLDRQFHQDELLVLSGVLFGLSGTFLVELAKSLFDREGRK